jgi:hypothetical protein
VERGCAGTRTRTDPRGVTPSGHRDRGYRFNRGQRCARPAIAARSMAPVDVCPRRSASRPSRELAVSGSVARGPEAPSGRRRLPTPISWTARSRTATAAAMLGSGEREASDGEGRALLVAHSESELTFGDGAHASSRLSHKPLRAAVHQSVVGPSPSGGSAKSRNAGTACPISLSRRRPLPQLCDSAYLASLCDCLRRNRQSWAAGLRSGSSLRPR